MLKNKTASLHKHAFILPVYVPTFLISLAAGIIAPILPLYLGEFEVGYGIIGLVLSGQAIGMLISDLPSGMAMRWLGQRRAMIIGLGLVALSSLALFWARSIPEALIYRILTGMGFSLFGVSRHAYIAANAVIGVRGRAVALFGGINRIGRFSGPAIGGLIGSALGLRVPFLVSGALLSLALLLVFWMVPRTAATQDRTQQPLRSYIQDLWMTARDQYRILTTVGLGQLFAQMVRTGRDAFIPLYGADVLGLSVAQIGWISSFASAIDMLLFYPVGMVMDRWGRKYAIVPSFLVQGIGFVLIPLTGGFASLAAVAGLIGFGNGLGSGTMLTLGADLAPEDKRGEFLGMWRLIGDAGFMLGPAVAGVVAGALALPAAALMLGSSGVVASMIFLFLVPETIQRGKEESTSD
jgi:MFS family permease